TGPGAGDTTASPGTTTRFLSITTVGIVAGRTAPSTFIPTRFAVRSWFVTGTGTTVMNSTSAANASVPQNTTVTRASRSIARCATKNGTRTMDCVAITDTTI